MTSSPIFARPKTAALVLADGTAFIGEGYGAIGEKIGEVCFNTAITGYQEILTDPSYSNQIIAFTTPHIGNVGTNDFDDEAFSEPAISAAIGCISKAYPTKPSNWRSELGFDEWLQKRGIIGLAGIDTRALTHIIREKGMQHASIVHNADGNFDIAQLAQKAANWSGLEGLDLAKDVSTEVAYDFETLAGTMTEEAKFHVVVMDFGAKANIMRDLAKIGARATVVPAATSFDEIMAFAPDGVMLSNGPGDPAKTGEYVVPVIKQLIAANIPIFGICLGHQMLGIALGGKTKKMKQGHHGANHPVQDLRSGKVEIVSMNHGFAVDTSSLPENVVETHVSLFDGSNCGLESKTAKAFSVQYHPEASPGPQDSFYLFEEFANLMQK
ncbi:MAG: glutamine-hydrolyzing carbamoyl-phosphate synthase small subunit [Pseudomonadota bacterium]